MIALCIYAFQGKFKACRKFQNRWLDYQICLDKMFKGSLVDGSSAFIPSQFSADTIGDGENVGGDALAAVRAHTNLVNSPITGSSRKRGSTSTPTTGQSKKSRGESSNATIGANISLPNKGKASMTNPTMDLVFQRFDHDNKETSETLFKLVNSRESFKKNKEAKKEAKIAQLKRCFELVVQECGFSNISNEYIVASGLF